MSQDRGGHYRWPGWIEICKESGVVRLMSEKDCSPDNFACEGLFGRLKNEFFCYRDLSGGTVGEFMEGPEGRLRHYGEGRPKESLGWMSPNRCRRNLGLTAWGRTRGILSEKMSASPLCALTIRRSPSLLPQQRKQGLAE